METFGRYQLLRRLGAGGMAEVFLARSTVAQGLAKLQVIKKIHPAFARSRHFVKMFVDEAKIALGLNHPNIVQVFDFGHVSQTYYLVMEYVEGVDLLRFMQEGARLGRRFPYGLCAYVVQQVAKGLDYAHRKTDEWGEPLHIVHRDVSPQNVLVSWDGAVKLVDFGIARARDVDEEQGVVKGKFAYMSPEQARGLPVDRRSDVFSAGVVLFELACARPLFTGKGKEVLDAVKAGAIPRPRDCDPALPPVLEEIILRALAYHADDRFQTARDLQHALGRFQFELAQEQGDLVDSSALAQFFAQTVPRERPGRPAGEPPTAGSTLPARAAGARPATAGAQAGPRSGDDVLAPPVRRSGELVPVPPPPAWSPGLVSPAATETRERKPALVIEAELSGLAALRRDVGVARARQAVAEFHRIAEHIAFKHEAVVHRRAERDEGRLTYVVGLPVAGEDDPDRALRLALALVDALDGIGRDVEPELRLAVGIQRGVAVVTRRGAAWEYELVGRAGSFALRLAREAQGGEVLVGGGVYRLARKEWNFEEVATVQLDDEAPEAHPGPDETSARRAKVYRLRGPKERAQRMRERAAGTAPIGRELELKALRDAYRDVVVHRRKQHVVILGDDGVGKRALVTTFLRALPTGEAMVLRAAARAATRDTPFSILADLARDLLGLAEGAEPHEVQRRLAAAAAMLYDGDDASREVQTLIGTMGMLLGVRPAGGEDIDGDERRARMLQVLRRLEERLARDQAVVIVVEDVHWADSASWDVFFERINEASPHPVLGIATARPDERVLQASAEAEHTTVLVLEELGPEERLRLITERFAPGEDVAALAQEVVAQAGGNPFFIHELLEALLERGIVAESRAHPGRLTWVRRDAPISAPSSLEALVAARLDRLPTDSKEALCRAAVFGREFSAADVEALLGRPADDALAALARRALIEPRVPAGWSFRNDLTRQVAYDLLPADQRALLHRRVAARLAAAPGYRAGQDDARIAHHLELGGDGEAAARRYLAAAQHARDVRGNVEAFRDLTRAILLLPRDAHAERFDARAEREAILRAWAHRPRQLRELHLLRREAEALGDPARLAQALTRLGQFYLDLGKTAAARRIVPTALEAARRAGAPLAEAEVLRLDAVVARAAGRYPDALALCDRALALCGDDRAGLLERAQILGQKGTVLWLTSRLRAAIEAHAEALVIHRKLRAPRQEARALNNMGIVFMALGEYDEALAHFKRALKIDQDLGDRAQVALKLANIGQVYVDTGDVDRAEAHLDKALAIAAQLRDSTTTTDATITLGQVHLKRGDVARARALFETGLAHASESRSPYQEIRALVYLALAKLQAGHHAEEVVDLARRATRLARQAPMPIGEAYGLAIEGLGLAALGRTAEGADRGAEAGRLLEALQTTEGADEIHHIHHRLARAAGREAEAREALRRAVEEVHSKARRLRDPSLRARFLAAPPARLILADHAALTGAETAG